MFRIHKIQLISWLGFRLLDSPTEYGHEITYVSIFPSLFMQYSSIAFIQSRLILMELFYVSIKPIQISAANHYLLPSPYS